MKSFEVTINIYTEDDDITAEMVKGDIQGILKEYLSDLRYLCPEDIKNIEVEKVETDHDQS